MKSLKQQAIAHVRTHGALLVFPVKNNDTPLSLWKCLFPRSTMRWDWSDAGDGRVAELWHLRSELSTSKRVVYAKWYQGRATLFSPELFTALLHLAQHPAELMEDSRRLLDILEDNSPIATKELRLLADLSGKINESRFTRAMRMLWNRLLIVGYGEVDEGGYPSLAMGASRLMFEELWDAASELSAPEARVRELLGADSLFFRWYQRQLRLCSK